MSFGVSPPPSTTGGGGVDIVASDASFSTGTVTLTGTGGGITVGTAANKIQLSVPSPVAQTTQPGVANLVASDNTFSSGTVSITGLGAATVNTAASKIQVSVPTQTTQPGVANLVASDATFSSGTVSITGLGAATVNTAASKIQVSVPTQTTQPGVQNLVASDNTFSSGTVSITGTGGGVTVNTAASKIQVSVAAPVAQTTQPGIQNLVASDNTFSSGTVSVTGAGEGITVNTAASKIQISGAQTGVKNLVASDNTFSSGTVTITGTGGGVTVNTAASKIQVSVAAPVAQTTQPGIQNLVASDNTFSSGTVSITGTGGGITVNTAASKIQLSVASPVAQTSQPVGSLSLSGNTAGTMANLPFASNIVLSAAGGATLSQSSGASSSIVQLSVHTSQSVQPGIQNLIASDNTFASGTVTITGTGGGVTINTAASKIQVSVASQSAAPVGSVAAAGNTTGTMGSLPLNASVGLVGGNNITLSQSSGAASTNFTISAPNTTSETLWNARFWENQEDIQLSGISSLNAFSKTPIYFPVTFNGNMTPKSIGVRLAAISSIASTVLQSFSIHLGVYTMVNSTSAALAGSGSDSFNISSNSSASYLAGRDFILTSPGTVAAISSLSPGNYIMGLMFSAGASNSMMYSVVGGTPNATSVHPQGMVHPGNNSFSTGTSQGLRPLYGQGSTTVNAMPANVSAPDLRNQGTATQAILPYVFIRS